MKPHRGFLWVVLALVALAAALVPAVSVQAQGGGVFSSDPVAPLEFNGSLSDLPRPVATVGEPREITRQMHPTTSPEFTGASQPDPLLAPIIPQPQVFTTPDRNFATVPYQSLNPADPIGDVGPNHYIQMANGSSGGSVVQIFDKSTPPVIQANTNMGAIWSAAGGSGDCASLGWGDPVVLWDSLADRWLLSQFADVFSTVSLCLAISQGPNPVSDGWYLYQFTNLPGFPDYPKYGVWSDAYYATANESVPALYAFDRQAMLAGEAATYQRISSVTALDGFSFQALTPADLDGILPPPPDSAGIFMRHVDADAHPIYSGGGNDFLEMYTLDVDFETPANTALNGPTRLTIAEFDSDLCGLLSFNCIAKPGYPTGASLSLDPLREVIMWRLAYRNFGTYQVLVGNIVTDVTGADDAGIRWFELRNSGSGWSVYQEGTYAGPAGTYDGMNRWMGSIAMDKMGNMALGYSVSNVSTVYPGIRYTGRLAGDALGTMPSGESVVIDAVANNGSYRWGDYSSMNIDPDECTFWYANIHGGPANGQWNQRGASFQYESCANAAPQNIRVVKDDGLTQVAPGQTITYTIAVTNTSAASITGVNVIDDFPADLTNVSWTCAVNGAGSCADPGPTNGDINTSVDLDPGVTATFTVTATVSASAVPGDEVTNLVYVDTPLGVVDADWSDNVARDTDLVVVPNLPDMVIAKSVDDNTPNAGQAITYTLTVDNAGTVDQTAVTVTDYVPSGVAWVSDTCAAGPPVGNVLTWVIGTVTPLDAPAVCQITVTVDAGTEGRTLINAAAVAGDLVDANGANNTAEASVTVNGDSEPGAGDTPAIAAFDPGISKVGVLQPGGLGMPGEHITWTITVVNNGSVGASDVVVTDTLPAELAVLSASTSRGTYSISGQTVTFNIGTLGAFESVTMQIVTRVLSNPASGFVANTATVAGGGQTDSTTATINLVTRLPSTGYSPQD